MTLKQQIIFWIAVLATFVIFLLVFRTILLPFVAGMALAYLLDPIADWFERQGMSRLAATFTILVLSIFVLGAAIVILLPILINQLIALISNIPDYVEKLRGLLDLAPQQQGDGLPRARRDVAAILARRPDEAGRDARHLALRLDPRRRPARSSTSSR